MTTTDRAPLDLTEQAITQIRHAVLHYYDVVKLDLADARLLLAEIERLRAEEHRARDLRACVQRNIAYNTDLAMRHEALQQECVRLRARVDSLEHQVDHLEVGGVDG